MPMNVAGRRGRRAFLSVVSRAAAAVAVAASLPAGASETPDAEGAVQLVRETTERLLAAAAADASVRGNPNRALALVDEHVAPHVDLERSSRWVLGKYWRRASPEQRSRFIQEFRVLLLRTYAMAVTENPEVSVEYLPVRTTSRPGEAVVRTRIAGASGAPPISVHYRLHGDASGWKLFDVSVEGISLVTTYRTTFSQRVKTRGIDGLIEDLANKNRENAAGA